MAGQSQINRIAPNTNRVQVPEFPPLPGDVLKRFESMIQWMEQMKRWITKLQLQLQNRNPSAQILGAPPGIAKEEQSPIHYAWDSDTNEWYIQMRAHGDLGNYSAIGVYIFDPTTGTFHVEGAVWDPVTHTWGTPP